MRILLAPDKFKGCLTASEVAAAMREGVRLADPSIAVDLCPMADGGEGTVEALVAATGGQIHHRRVTGPRADMSVEAAVGILGDAQTAVIEMSSASGLALLDPADRNPLHTTTYGTGELIVSAVKMGCRRIILGIGGSATVDGGLGCAQACGLPVLMRDGEPVSNADPLVGADLERVMYIKRGRGSLVDGVQITVACDVTNPLTGPSGAARVYGPQKGASAEDIEKLDRWLGELAMRTHTLDEANQPGAGAAGGLGWAMAAFFGATLKPGIDLVIDAVELPHRIEQADLCITGEGRLDAQSLHGKTPIGVARRCREAGVPCLAIAGSVQTGLAFAATGVTAAFATTDGPLALEEAVQRASTLIAHTTAQIIRTFISARSRR